MSYKKYKWEVIANDYNSCFIRHYLSIKSLYNTEKVLGFPRFMFSIISRKNDIEYLTDIDSWGKSHEKIKKEALGDINFLDNLINKIDKHCKSVNAWTEKEIFKADLSSVSNKKLFNLLELFIEKQGSTYMYGLALPILDFHSFSYIEGNIKNYLKDNVSEKDYQKYYNIFTSPIHNSFAQDQEEALLKLISKFYNNKTIIKNIKNKNLVEIKKDYPEFYSQLKKHAKKFGQVYYVYTGPAFGEEDFLGFIKQFLEEGINPVVKLKNIISKKKETEKLRKEYIKKLNPDKFNKNILTLAGKFVWAKPRRKDYQSLSYYHSEKLFKEIAKRLHISLNQARSATPEIIENALLKNKLDIDKINDIYNKHIILPNDDETLTILVGEKAESFFRENVKKEQKKIKKNIKELSGDVACAGKAKGVIKMINKPEDMVKMKKGDILLSTATTPSIVAAMKKAAAIVTDEGGLTCHASIVSRELNIPCIVGLRIATKVFKDGDKVEVDAHIGIIKKIK